MWDDDGTVYYSMTTLENNGGDPVFESPVIVNFDNKENMADRNPQVSVDFNGNLMAVWDSREHDDPYEPYKPDHRDIYISFSGDSGKNWSILELLTFDTNSPNADDRRPALVYHPSDKNSTWSVFFESRNRDFAESKIYRSLVFNNVIGKIDIPTGWTPIPIKPMPIDWDEVSHK